MIIIVLLRLIALCGSIWCDLSLEWCAMGWFNECKMTSLIQKNCSKVPHYSSKTPLKYGQMLNYYQTWNKSAMRLRKRKWFEVVLCTWFPFKCTWSVCFLLPSLLRFIQPVPTLRTESTTRFESLCKTISVVMIPSAIAFRCFSPPFSCLKSSMVSLACSRRRSTSQILLLDRLLSKAWDCREHWSISPSPLYIPSDANLVEETFSRTFCEGWRAVG